MAQWSKGVSGASWLEAGATETTASQLDESDISDSPATFRSDQADELQPLGAEPAEPAELEPEPTAKVEQDMSTKFLELHFREVCHCVQNSNDDLFARLEALFERQAERQHDLQTKLDAITEDTTARFMAKVARDMVQAEPSPKPPICPPTSLVVEKPELPGTVTPPGDTEARPFWGEPRDEADAEAEVVVASRTSRTSRTSDISLGSDQTPPATSLLQREDEAAYQAALAKARKLQHRETTKRLTRQNSSSQSEHWQLRLHEFMQTALMESICAGVIFTNSILIGVQTDYMAKRLGEEQPLVFTVVDAAYTAIFGLELAVRLLGSGLGFFYRDSGLFWNYLDVVIVLPSVMELVLAFFLQLPFVSTDITVIRVLRITRVFRVIRVVKVMKFIRSLRQLVESVMHTMRSLAWSMILLIMIIYVFAIMFTDASASWQETNPESVLNTDLRIYFGDLHTAMHTLFRSVSGGIDWGMVAHTLGEVNWIWTYLFSLYVAFCMFAVLNVMTGIFCQVAVESSWNDPQLLLQHSMVERERQHDQIRQLFQSFRQETTRRKITLIDIEENFDDEGVQGLMNLLDIYPETGWSLFKQLDDNGDASISEEEFVSGVFRLKGTAKSWDMEKIMQEQRGLRKILDAYIANVGTGSDKRAGRG